MPFTIADVDKHNKGLNDRQKQLWLRVANDGLARCEREGGKDCDASAIRQANAVVARNLTVDLMEFSEKEWEGFAEKIVDAINEYAHTQTFNIEGVEIFAEGVWNGDKYTSEDLDQMIAAFDTVGFEPPLKLGHNSEQEKDLMKDGHPAFGWVGRVYREGTKLLADFKELPQKLYEALKRGNYKTVSSEIFWNYRHDGQTLPRVLKAVSLLGADVPAVTSLEAIENLYAQNADEVREYQVARASALDIGEAAKTREQEIKKEERKMENEAKVKELEDETKVLTNENEDLKKKNDKLEAENKESKAKLSEREAEVRTAKVKEFIVEQKAAGKIIPAIEKEAEALLISASEEKTYSFDAEGKTVELSQRETFERFIKALPKMIEFKEQGEEGDEIDFTGDEWDNPGKEVDRRAKVLMDKGEIKDYSEAMQKVLADDDKLKDAYAKGGK